MDPRLARLLLVLAATGAGAIAGKSHAAESKRKDSLQNSFLKFHERIRHEQLGERDLLRERREKLQTRLKEALDPQLRPKLFQQGSYALQTGVKPLSGLGFDIDLGLTLECPRSVFSNPIEAKQLVRDALRQGSRRVRIRRSCVTVEYTDKNFGDYHVDIAVYLREPDGQMYLAKGKEHSEQKFISWERASPEELMRLLNSKFNGTQVAQFRRCIRYLKRWKHVNFTTKVPYSIALTLAAYHWFRPTFSGFWSPTPNDLGALLQMTTSMLEAVQDGRLRIPLPTGAKVDLMERLTQGQMTEFLAKLERLNQTLARASDSSDLERSTQELSSVFGPEFD